MSNESKGEGKTNGEAQALPEDVATLYSWANLHGAKYRDFSATRQEVRSQTRLRAQEEAAEKEIAREAKSAPEIRGTWEELKEEPSAAEAETANAAPAFVRQPEPIVTTPPARPSFYPAAQEIAPVEPSTVSRAEARPKKETVQQPRAESLRDAEPVPSRPWKDQEQFSPIPNPVFRTERPQPSHERPESRWFALNSLLNEPRNDRESQTLRQKDLKIPALAIFSLAGGVGKTSLVATVGRALAAYGEKVLLVDTNSYGLLPLYYGAKEVRPGMVRTFSDGGSHAAVQMLTLDAELYTAKNNRFVVDDIVRSSRGTDRVLIDVATGSSDLTRQVLRLAPRVLVPLIPDISSIASLQAVEAFFSRLSDDGNHIHPTYILNRLDASIPLHRDVREALRQKLGDRLLPFALRRTSALSEALAQGMTVVDYSPNAEVVEDYAALSSWIRSLSAPANAHRGHRWSEQ